MLVGPKQPKFWKLFWQDVLILKPWWGCWGLHGWPQRVSCLPSLRSVGKALWLLVLQQQQKVITGLDLGGRKQNLHFNVHMLSSLSNSPPREIIVLLARIICAGQVWSGNASVGIKAAAPGWKHCKDELRAWGKVIPNKAIRVPFSWMHAVLVSVTVSFAGLFGPVTDLSLTMLLLLPCESRDARMLWRRMPLIFLSMYWLCNSDDWDIIQRNMVCLCSLRRQRTCICVCFLFRWKLDPVNA